MMNPYNWQSTHPAVTVRRPEVGKASQTLLRGGSVLVLGGRGMGKSVFLRQLERELQEQGDLGVFVVPAPPPQLEIDVCLSRLADALGVAAQQRYVDTRQIVDAWFADPENPSRLILLFDEFDRYADLEEASPRQPPGRAFFNDLEITRRDRDALGVLAAGSVGVFAFRDSLGSSFLSRAEHRPLHPFNRGAVVDLASPLQERGGLSEVSSEAVVDALLLASGGLPSLVAYGLQELWALEREVDARDVASVFAEFQQTHLGYIDDVYKAFADPRLSEAPRRVLERFRDQVAEEGLSRRALEQVCEDAVNPLQLSLADVLLVLTAAGLLHLESKFFAGDPVRGHAVPSLLNLPTTGRGADDFGERFARDLELLLGKLHGASADFFRPGRDGRGKRLLPEAVFAAHLALGFELLGWHVEREAQSAAGRTDLKLRYSGGPEIALAEIKIWGRGEPAAALEQLRSYWTQGVAAGAVVWITDAEVLDWPERYRQEALGGVQAEKLEVAPPLADAFRSFASEGAERVDHFFLRLPRRDR